MFGPTDGLDRLFSQLIQVSRNANQYYGLAKLHGQWQNHLFSFESLFISFFLSLFEMISLKKPIVCLIASETGKIKETFIRES